MTTPVTGGAGFVGSHLWERGQGRHPGPLSPRRYHRWRGSFTWRHGRAFGPRPSTSSPASCREVTPCRCSGMDRRSTYVDGTLQGFSTPTRLKS